MGAKSSNEGRDVETEGTKLLTAGFVEGLEKGFKDGEDTTGATFTP